MEAFEIYILYPFAQIVNVAWPYFELPQGRLEGTLHCMSVT